MFVIYNVIHCIHVIKVITQIKNDLKGNEDTPYVNIDPHFEHSYGQISTLS